MTHPMNPMLLALYDKALHMVWHEMCENIYFGARLEASRELHIPQFRGHHAFIKDAFEHSLRMEMK